MERIMSVEEKIKRAEEIYARRNSRGSIGTTRVGVNNKKEIKVVKKLIIQMIICIFIYGVFYLVKNSNFVFSEDFVNKTKEVLSYDVNFAELYNNASEAISGFLNTNEKENNDNVDENNKEQETKTNEEENTGKRDEENQEAIGGADETQELPNISEEEQKIQQIKNTASFIKPVEGPISSKFGVRNPTTSTVPKNHTGTDIAANTGTKIKAATDGEVVIASEEGDYGKHLKIQIGEVSVIYAHCNSLYVKQGDIIKQGQEIAEVGSTGNSTGPHLHFEIRLNEVAIDPEKILEL